MIPINKLQVNNWVQFLGQCQQIALIDKKNKKVMFKSGSCLISYKYIDGISLYDNNYQERVIDGLNALETGFKAVEYQCTNDVEYVHELQNKCKDATNIKL